MHQQVANNNFVSRLLQSSLSGHLVWLLCQYLRQWSHLSANLQIRPYAKFRCYQIRSVHHSAKLVFSDSARQDYKYFLWVDSHFDPRTSNDVRVLHKNLHPNWPSILVLVYWSFWHIHTFQQTEFAHYIWCSRDSEHGYRTTTKHSL